MNASKKITVVQVDLWKTGIALVLSHVSAGTPAMATWRRLSKRPRVSRACTA